MMSCHRDHPHPGSRFRRRAGNRGAEQGPHRYRRRRHVQRHLPRQRERRADRRADARALSRHGGGRDRAPRRRGAVALAVAGPHRHSPRSAASRRARTSCWCVTASSHRQAALRSGGIPDGLSEDQRAVLEARGKRKKARAGSRRATMTTPPPRAGPNPDGQTRKTGGEARRWPHRNSPRSAPANC